MDDTRIEDIVSLFLRTSIPLSPSAVERIIEARDDIGSRLADLLYELIDDDGTVTAADAIWISTMLLDGVTDRMVSELRRNGALADEGRLVLLLRVQRFIDQRLGDRDLTPMTIASAHNISLRYLQKLFQLNGLSVAAWIRNRRLERCRRDLTDPAQVNVPVRTIGTRWGFLHDAHFNRAFRAVYGIPPAAYRQKYARMD
ncbi:helix-turn-helix domain-containing protein [Nonomuraea sp. NPDC049480]|uniref:helix-turn-helix domain-containing protein n=1 Tax=Nonomuraea sp. NPDC049480 TaxID=3364353 RepID=UPI0037940F15